MFETRHPRGILVNIAHRNTLVWDVSPQPAALSIYIGVPRRFFVNGEEIPREDLRAKLLQHQRVPWVVYFEADANIPYMDAVYAIDAIQSSGAELIWIAPKLRNEWKHTRSARISAENPSTVHISMAH